MAKVTITVTLETQWVPITVTREIEVDDVLAIAGAMRELAHEVAHTIDNKYSDMYWRS